MSNDNIFKEKVRIDLSKCQYDVLYEVAKELKWECEYDYACDIIWQDSALNPTFLSQLNSFQRINHFPGIYGISRKDYLAKHLKLMESFHPSEFNFFPNTWILPQELNSLKKFMTSYSGAILICKPPNSSQGKGIFLTRSITELPQTCIVQRYLENPLLIDGLKFDLRIYVLVTGVNPLRVYVHEEGLVRLATNSYYKPTDMNMQNIFMHLTNYAINKSSPNYVYNKNSQDDFVGHKRSFKALLKRLEEDGRNVDKLLNRIDDIILKTLCTVQPFISHIYRSSQPNDSTSAICFQILGFDIFLDNTLKPKLLEVNHTPSFTTDSPLDKHVKKTVIRDCLKMIGVQADCKNRFQSERINFLIEKTYQNYHKVKDIKNKQKEEFLARVVANETTFQGGFRKVFPGNNMEKYENYIKDAEKYIFGTYLRHKRILKAEKIRTKTPVRKSAVFPHFSQKIKTVERRKSCIPRIAMVPKVIQIVL